MKLLLAAIAAVVVASPAPSAHRESSCTADATTALVRTFASAYSRGHVAAAIRLWAPKGRFRWFSVSKPHARLGRDAYDRSTLAMYFRARARAHERIRVSEPAAGYDASRNIVHFGGQLVRSADDVRPRLLEFKGAADCVSRQPRLIVWSM